MQGLDMTARKLVPGGAGPETNYHYCYYFYYYY